MNEPNICLIHGDALVVLKTFPDNTFDALCTDPPAGISFLNKPWDSDKGGRDAWIAWLAAILREVHRVLKPGAHGLVWALPRTSGWTHRALEDAGFEVRDVLQHLFFSGFPKSLDISKAIDRELGAQRERQKIPFHRTPALGTRNAGETRPWVEAARESGFHEVDGDEPVTEDAKQWLGWKTCLKPSAEFWILIRKPLESTVAENILKYGVGGLNIDACRIGTERRFNPPAGNDGSSPASIAPVNISAYAGKMVTGRYPAHTIISHETECTDQACLPDCAVLELNRQSGYSRSPVTLSSGKVHGAQKTSPTGQLAGLRARRGIPCYGDEGGASRFLYCPKPGKQERGEGNTHPTVKPQALMRYMLQLITPPGGTVLDPFAGSGSTLTAAQDLGLTAIGIERQVEYVEIAKRRLVGTRLSMA